MRISAVLLQNLHSSWLTMDQSKARRHMFASSSSMPIKWLLSHKHCSCLRLRLNLLVYRSPATSLCVYACKPPKMDHCALKKFVEYAATIVVIYGLFTRKLPLLHSVYERVLIFEMCVHSSGIKCILESHWEWSYMHIYRLSIITLCLMNRIAIKRTIKINVVCSSIAVLKYYALNLFAYYKILFLLDYFQL